MTAGSISSGEIHLWSTTLDRESSELESSQADLSIDEVARARRYIDSRVRCRFIACRAALRRLLGRYLSRDPCDVQFSYLSHGKPELSDVLSTGLYFNLTHSGDLAMIALGRDRRIGVDIERIRPEFATEAAAARFFSEKEQAAIRDMPVSQRVEAFFRCWTRKEAFIKAIGDGLTFPLDQFDVSLGAGERAELLAIRDDAAEARRWSLRELTAPAGYVAALAVDGPIDRVLVQQGPI